jgi:NAD+ diphosphatase
LSGAYIFQGNSLVVPNDTPDSEIQEEISLESIDSALGGVHQSDNYLIPSLDERDRIRFITIPEGDLPPGWKAIPMRQALTVITGGGVAAGRGPAGRILRSYHVSLWRGDSRFCGSCGGANRDADSGELAGECTVCGRMEVPRVSPAVITIITNDRGEALLAHNKKFASGVYSLIAGFNEAGESLEDTIAREAKEEVNLELTDIRYIRSQPWPFPNSLMLGFSARYKSGELRPDGNEIADARWFSRDALPALPGGASISRYLIELWREGKL